MLSVNSDPVIIKEKIQSYITQAAHAENGEIKNNSLIFKEGYLDSMGFIMLITFLENEIGISTDDEDLIEDNFESINAISEFINKKTKSA